jgi:hypothetical protein
MKTSIIALVVAATLAFVSAANAGLLTYRNGCVSTAAYRRRKALQFGRHRLFRSCRQRSFLDQHDNAEYCRVATCNYSLDKRSYNINPDGTGLAGTLYKLETAVSSTTCPGRFGGNFNFVCSEGQFRVHRHGRLDRVELAERHLQEEVSAAGD